MISRDSLSLATRSLGGGDPKPNVSNSLAIDPHPMPSSKRPPEAWSIVTASRASTAG